MDKRARLTEEQFEEILKICTVVFGKIGCDPVVCGRCYRYKSKDKEKGLMRMHEAFSILAPRVGLEPTT